MPGIILDIPSLYSMAFNYNSKAFEFEQQPTRKELSDLGSAYYSIDEITGREYYMPVWLGDVELWHPVINVVDCRKQIIDTPLVETKGTVKEIINIDDYQIVIRGVILNNRQEFPEQQVKTLRQLYERNEALSIINAITDLFLVTSDRKGFDKVIIKDMRVLPIQGVKNSVGYELNIFSDVIFTLIEE